MAKKDFIYISILFFLVVIGLSFLHSQNKKAVSVLGECEVKYSHLNKRLGCEPKPAIKKYEYTEFVQELKNYIGEEESSKKVKHVSVYFRDLEYGPTFGIKEQEKFAPASLLKVPLLITYLSLTESDPSVLEKQLSYSKIVEMVKQSEKEIPPLQPNTPYAVEELLSRMIIYSDNISYWLLSNYLNKSFSDNPHLQTMRDLGLINPRSSSESTITVKSYASLFRQLYNSSYLSPQMSEKALGLLLQSKYDEGLKLKSMKDIRIAHKFGELGLPNGEKQLHDCGIIYFPENPYLLCVMTRGDSFDEQSTVIQNISEKVYKEVDSRKY